MPHSKAHSEALAPAIDYLHRAVPSLQAVYLFGSSAAGTERPESDVDLAFLAETSPSPEERFEISAELGVLVNRDVDLVDLSRASTVLRAQVLRHGRRILGEDTAALAEFEARVLSDYARLNEERAGILEDVERRGSIHG